MPALIDRYGEDTVSAAISELEHRSEQQMRAYIDEVPDGVYTSTAYMDSDGIVDEPLEIQLEMTVPFHRFDQHWDENSEPLPADMIGRFPQHRQGLMHRLVVKSLPLARLWRRR